jgi:hypothetical protein
LCTPKQNPRLHQAFQTIHRFSPINPSLAVNNNILIFDTPSPDPEKSLPFNRQAIKEFVQSGDECGAAADRLIKVIPKIATPYM